MRLRLALYYDYRVHAGTPEEAAKRNQALIQHTALAESCGFDMVWLAEHPTNPEAAMPSALILCAAIAAQTDTMRFGTGVLPLPLYHPLRVAEDAASIDGLGNGRFELGVGLGGEVEGFQDYGVEVNERSARFEESIILLRQAWSKDEISFQGAHFEIEGIQVVPKPTQPLGPPIWIGAGVPEAQRRAARLGTGLFVPQGASPIEYLRSWNTFNDNADLARVALLCPEEDFSEAVEKVKAFSNLPLSLDLVVPALGPGGLRSTKELQEIEKKFRDGLLSI